MRVESSIVFVFCMGLSCGCVQTDAANGPGEVDPASGAGGSASSGEGAAAGGSAGAVGGASSAEELTPVDIGIAPTVCEATAVSGPATSISLDGNDIAVGNVNGLTFKGFGVLSANGTSELLMDYKAEHPEAYAQMLGILFGGTRPVMTQVKIEMGNDRNNSTGPDAATMRTASEAANVQRHPGFQLAADASKLNPNLRVGILRWNAPAWANNNDSIYTWYKNTILAAYRTYGYMIDYVNPGINESTADLAWTRDYAARVSSDAAGFESAEEQALYNAIQVVISDEAAIGTFGGALVADQTLRSAVSVAGYHYNTDDDGAGNFKRLADELDFEVWNSEAQATFSNTAFRPNNNMRDPSVVGTGIGGIGGPLEMGNTIIKGFVNSRRTHFIYQPAIGSFYEGGMYAFKELISARDPWSGFIHYDGGLQILRHFSWFAKTGWENAENTAGIWRAVPRASSTGATGTNPVSGRNGTPSYMTLAAPDKRDFSMILMNDSEQSQTYQISAVNMAYAEPPALEVWETRAADPGAAFNASYLRHLCNLSADGAGAYQVTVKPYSVMTVTTLHNTEGTEFRRPLPVEGARTVLDTDAAGAGHDTSDSTLYADDFDYSARRVAVIAPGGALDGSESHVASRGGPQGALPRFFCDRNGAFEAFLPSGSENYVLRQKLDQGLMGLGGTWHAGDPITGIGDNRWLNYRASVDVSFESDNLQAGSNYAAIGARQQGGPNAHTLSGTPYVLKFSFDGGWQLLVDGGAVASGNVVSGVGGVTIAGFDAAFDAWHNIALEVVGSQVTALLDGAVLTAYTDARPRLSGRVDLASGYYNTRFDNLKVETIADQPPYYSELLDDLEMHDLAAPPAQKLVYGGGWVHENGRGMYNYHRSLSTSQGLGATLEYTFTGTGLDILGPNGGSAQLTVSVDGQVVATAVPTQAATEFYQTYSLRGLAPAEHHVRLEVTSGNLVVDAVAVVP